MSKPNIKEIREWLNFVLTALTPVAIAVAALVLKNTKLEIEKDVADNYVSKAWFQSYETQTNQKLDALSSSLTAVQTDVAEIKGRLAAKHSP